jgi:hypothetical protein
MRMLVNTDYVTVLSIISLQTINWRELYVLFFASMSNFSSRWLIFGATDRALLFLWFCSTRGSHV